jgi:hypothetical protein
VWRLLILVSNLNRRATTKNIIGGDKLDEKYVHVHNWTVWQTATYVLRTYKTIGILNLIQDSIFTGRLQIFLV